MSGERGPVPPIGRESPAAILGRLLAVAAAIGAVGFYGLRKPAPATPAAPAAAVAAAESVPEPAPHPIPEPDPVDEPEPPAPPAPLEPDPVAIARARAELDAASRDRARADHRAAEAARALRTAELEVARLVAESRTLGSRVRDPSARIISAQAKGEALSVAVKSLEGELAALAQVPKPRLKPLVDKSPVARPPHGDEFHFEVRRGRVAYIDLEGLLDRVRTDARIQLRMAEGLRPIRGKVGPVGAFRIDYEMAPDGIGMGRSGLNASYSLSGWEIVPTSDLRGETLEQAFQPASDFARAINSLDPSQHAITMWVYPDGFALYRQLRDALHQSGFLVSARPLPEAMPIRGSPVGSVSAGQ